MISLAAPVIWVAWVTSRKLSALSRVFSDYQYATSQPQLWRMKVIGRQLLKPVAMNLSNSYSLLPSDHSAKILRIITMLQKMKHPHRLSHLLKKYLFSVKANLNHLNLPRHKFIH